MLRPQNTFPIERKKVSSLEEDVDGVISKQVFCQWDLTGKREFDMMLNLLNFSPRAHLYSYNP